MGKCMSKKESTENLTNSFRINKKKKKQQTTTSTILDSLSAPLAAASAAFSAPVAAATDSLKKVFREPTIAVQKLNIIDVTKDFEKQLTSFTRHATKHVRNVFATPLDFGQGSSYKPPVHPKSPEDAKLIQDALLDNLVFEHLNREVLQPLVLAFEQFSAPAGQVLIQQGDEGNFFYIIHTGRCQFNVDGQTVGEAGPGNSFGELALLYNCPRAATVTALTDADLFRVDQKCFRYIMESETKKGSQEKLNLLQGVEFLAGLSESDIRKLAHVMTPHKFKRGDYLIRKGEDANEFYIIQEGQLQVTDISSGNVKYDDLIIEAGAAVGENALVTDKPRAANICALSDGSAFKINKSTFQEVLGNLNDLILRSMDKVKLQGIKIFVDSEFDSQTISSIAALFVDQQYSAGTIIMEAGKETEAALYLVRQGAVDCGNNMVTMKIRQGGYFGSELLLADVKRGSGERGKDPTTVMATTNITCCEDCVFGVLTLAKLRTIINTVYLGRSPVSMLESMLKRSSIPPLHELKRHQLLGAGTFGQVWLVSYLNNDDNKRDAYALKIQSKYELTKEKQAKAVVNEKNIMAKMNHPFLCSLVASYQDEQFVYMLLGILQGGELYSVLHATRGRDGAQAGEGQAKFYAAAIADALGYMHRRGYVYRDLKPENVMIDADGYTVLVDFGFAKYVPDKTYTLCGTPLYLPPEIILNRGHNQAADHWSLGVLIYEMLTGQTPFYQLGMEQMELFRTIVKCQYEFPTTTTSDNENNDNNVVPAHAQALIRALLTKSPSQRLGSLRHGEDDIAAHAWFEDLDFELLVQKKLPAPYRPTVTDPLDATHFEDWSHLEDKTQHRYPRLTVEEAKVFYKF